MTRNEEILKEALNWKIDDNEFIAQTAFEAGAKWADEHPQSPWVPIDGKHSLPEPGKLVLLYYPIRSGEVEISKRIKSKSKRDKGEPYDGHDEYGFEVKIEVVNVTRFRTREIHATYWMPIPELPKGGEK